MKIPVDELTRQFSLSTRLPVNSSTLKKTFFLFLPSHPHKCGSSALFIGVSVVRVSVRASDLPSHLPSRSHHLPSHPYSSGKKASCLLRILWMGVRFNRQGAKKQLFTGSIAMVYCWRSYAALLVQLCCTFGARMLYSSGTTRTVGIPMLDCWYSYAKPLVYLC